MGSLRIEKLQIFLDSLAQICYSIVMKLMGTQMFYTEISNQQILQAQAVRASNPAAEGITSFGVCVLVLGSLMFAVLADLKIQ